MFIFENPYSVEHGKSNYHITPSPHAYTNTNYQLPITNYQLPIINYQLPIINYQLPITKIKIKSRRSEDDQGSKREKLC